MVVLGSHSPGLRKRLDVFQDVKADRHSLILGHLFVDLGMLPHVDNDILHTGDPIGQKEIRRIAYSLFILGIGELGDFGR